jgi:predicted nucleic acid-binding protein
VSRIVCNSGPLIALGILGRLDILKFLVDEVMVPEAVRNEIEQGGTKIVRSGGFPKSELD